MNEVQNLLFLRCRDWGIFVRGLSAKKPEIRCNFHLPALVGVGGKSPRRKVIRHLSLVIGTKDK